jgi:fructose-1,6-bisphosphatase I
MLQIFETIKKIAFEIEYAIGNEELGYSDSENSSGEEQLKLDIKSDLIIEKAFATVPSIKAIVSEEKEGIVELNPSGEYMICYDPLDGSSLVNVNLSIGSIFGIYKGGLRGKNLVASTYIIYGPRVEIVYSERNKRPILYRRDRDSFKMSGEIVLNKKGNINATGGTQKHWKNYHKKFMDNLFQEGYRLRYSGGMVPDLHQILIKGGGLFSYPATSDRPNGKLRQLFEVIPFALIYEQAGGKAINDKGERLLESIPNHLHDTTPCFFGSTYEIDGLKEAYGVK